VRTQEAERSWQDKAKRWGRTCLRLALLKIALMLSWTALTFLSGSSVSLRSWLERNLSTSIFAVAPIYLALLLASYIVVLLPLDWLAWKAEVKYGLSRKGLAAWFRHFIVGSLVGLIFGVAFFSGAIGGAVGPIMGGYVFDVTSSYQLVFLVYAAVSIIGIILTSFLRPVIGKEES